MDENRIRLSIGSCMQEILREYGYGMPTIKICEHMINDLLSLLISQGYINNQPLETEENIKSE